MSDEATNNSGSRIIAESAVRVAIPAYEGPLDLLLHLLKKAELEPRDVAVSSITEAYLAHLELLNQLNLDVAGEYLVMAATLLLIKSYSLLPRVGPEDEEEADGLKRDLIERLLEYQRYREAAEKLGERALVGRDVFTSVGEHVEPGEQGPRFTVTLFDLVEAMGTVLKRLADKAPRDIQLRDIPIAHCVPRIMEALSGGRKIEFVSLFEDLDDRSLVIATFIALLELVRRRVVSAFQEMRPGPIWIERGPEELGEIAVG
ncbi:MAG TPA: segregation/condensation protein A [Candidatus Binataceae bacterium]|nr:segregation/condensation protein A [Candidatus Binataceae bacterium]